MMKNIKNKLMDRCDSFKNNIEFVKSVNFFEKIGRLKRLINNLVIITPLVFSYITFFYTRNQNLLLTELDKLDKFYESAASFPSEIEDYPVLLIANLYNTKNENHKLEIETHNKIIKDKTVIEININEKNDYYDIFYKQLEKYYSKSDIIKKYSGSNLRYLVELEMNQEIAGHTFNKSENFSNLERERYKLEKEFNEIQTHTEDYYQYLNKYYNSEKESLKKKYSNCWWFA